MVSIWRWSDAQRLAEWLAYEPDSRNALLLLQRLPFLPAGFLERLVASRDDVSIQRSLLKLRESGLIARVQAMLYSGSITDFYHLTDLGLGACAVMSGSDRARFARQHEAYASLLSRLLRNLPLLHACYEMLTHLVSVASCHIVSWEHPWRRRWYRPWSKSPVTVSVPAFVMLEPSATDGGNLLCPDLGQVPVRCHRPMLAALLAARSAIDGPIPRLLIAAPDERRAEAWQNLLEEVAIAAHEAPFAASIVLWHRLAGDPRGPFSSGVKTAGDSDLTGRHCDPTRQMPPRPGSNAIRRCLPRSLSAANVDASLRSLDRADWSILHLLAHHPFLSWSQISAIRGWTLVSSERRLRNLIAKRLVQALGKESGRSPQGDPLRLPLEVTANGLELIARQYGVSLAQAVRLNGLAGGGPQRPVGDRQRLLHTLSHTLGANEVFVGIFRAARARALAGHDEFILDWRNAAACAHGGVWPDGYGLYRRERSLYGFFLEYDRGTENFRDYLRKFNAYYDYWLSGRYLRDYVTLPTILVVTTTAECEERIGNALRATSMGRPASLPALLTHEGLSNDPRNTEGLLGCIWREPTSSCAERRPWIEP